MDQSNNSLSDNLEKLFELFKKLKDKLQNQNVLGLDAQLFQSFDLIISNYEQMKKTVPTEVLDEYKGPVKDLVEKLIYDLRNELDDFQDASQDIKDSISEIDDLLKSSKLSDGEIDNLLDKRSKLIRKKK